MTNKSSPAEGARIVRNFYRLYSQLTALIEALESLEPGGTLIDDITFDNNRDGPIRIEFTAKPLMLAIRNRKRIMILRTVELTGDTQAHSKG